MNMQKRLTMLAAAVAGASLVGPAVAPAAVLGEYRFQGSDPASDNDIPTSTTLTFTAFQRTGVTQVNTNNVFNSNAWTTAGAIDTAEHTGFTVTPVTGYTLLAQSLNFDHSRSTGANGGPTAGEVRHSVNAFGAGQSFTPSATTSFNFADFSTTGATTFRFHAWGASNANGTLSFDNVQLIGDVQARASLNSAITTAAPSRVIVGASNVRHVVTITNNTLTGGTVAAEGLDYAVAATGTGLSVSSPGGAGLAGAASAMHFVNVDTTTAGTKGGSAGASSTNAFRANGVVGATSASHALTNVDVLDHANGSFAGDANADTLTLDFGTVEQGSSQSRGFSLHNLVATAGYTAALDLDSIGETDAAGVFSTDLATFLNLVAGGSNTYSVTLDTSSSGAFAATYTLNFSDEDLAGAAGGQTLTLNVLGEVVPVPEPTALVFAGLAGLLLCRHRRNVR
jgi:hypothetical protein